MTFTKGIGTPVYMSPEMLDRKKYKKAADIYSLAITFLEIMTFDDPFPKTLYKFPWNIADHVSRGLRPILIEQCEERAREIIKGAWSQSFEDRPSIKTILNQLETLYLSYNEYNYDSYDDNESFN